MTDAWSLDGRVALVIGAGRGIGRGCALELAKAGAAVVAVARSGDEIDETVSLIEAEGGTAVSHVADVTSEKGVESAVKAAEDLGDLRVCMNGAGTNVVGPARSYKVEDWDLLMEVNVRATFLGCRAAGDSMLTRKVRGSIINMSSQMGAVGFPGRAAYCASKHAVDGLSQALGVEWAPDGIRVNSVAPTFVLTPLTAPMFDDPEFKAEVMRRIPAGEVATIEQVSHAVRYLACDASGSVTGSVLRVDGGWTAW